MNLLQFVQKVTGMYLNFMSFIVPNHVKSFGFNLFCTPFAKKLKPFHRDFLQSGKSFLLDFQGDHIQTYQWGHGKKSILLIHGWASNTFRWKSYIEILVEKEYTVYALDAPAHGLSTGKYLTLPLYTEILDAFIDKIGIPYATIGHSIGGYALIYWLSSYKKTEDMLAIIMAAPGEVSDFFSYYKNVLNLNKKTTRLLGEEFIMRTGKNPEDFSSQKLVVEVKNPALIIHDIQDKDTSYHYSERIHAIWPGSELLLTDGLGHKLKSKKLQDKIISFIN